MENDGIRTVLNHGEEQLSTAATLPESETTTVSSPKQSKSNPATSTGLGIAEIALRVICMVFCITISVAGVLGLIAINEVEDYFNDNGMEYEQVDSYRKAMRWLTLVAIMGAFFHFLMILLRYLYLTSYVKLLFSVYAYLNAALCVVFGLSLFAGGVANAIYAANNAETLDDIINVCDQPDDITTHNFCNAFKRVRDIEATAASMSFFTMIIFAVLLIITISSGVMTSQGGHNNESSTDDTAPSSSSYMPLNSICRPIDAPPPYTP